MSKDLPEFLESVQQERASFNLNARSNWWMELGVNRVPIENILIMYDQMYERLKNLEAASKQN